MIRRTLSLSLAAGLVAVAAGCGQGGSDPPGPKGVEQIEPSGERAAARAESKRFVLAAEPAGAKGVIGVRKDARDGDEVVVAGRVGGSAKPFTEGRASFLIVDPSLEVTEGCDTPWDFCELPKKEVAAARLNVKLVDADGKTVKHGAREMFNIKELSQVVVKGKVSRDDKDNVVVVATGVFVRPDPK